MYTLLITIHVLAMISSLTLMVGAVVWGLRGRDSAVRLADVGMACTVIGTVTGVALLLFTPLLLQCVILSVYLFGTTIIYAYGFGNGSVANARFVRRTHAVDAYDDMV